jgi:hypothetical protein
MQLLERPDSCRWRSAPEGRDLPDADRPGFVALNGRFGGVNRSAGGPKAGIDDAEMAAWKRPFNTSKCGHAGGVLKVPLLAFRSD